MIRNFNPLAPHGARLESERMSDQRRPFQSTRPARGETTLTNNSALPYIISIHSPRTGRDARTRRDRTRRPAISIHSPRTGRDQVEHCHRPAVVLFQSTRPARGETPRTLTGLPNRQNFNPLAPHGARRYQVTVALLGKVFQSTRPARGETARLLSLLWVFGHFNPLAPHGARRQKRTI